jgi:hypothetical protein
MPDQVTPPTLGQVMLDYSVRAETAGGCLRNALQLLQTATPHRVDGVRRVLEGADYAAILRLVQDALAKIESRTALTGAPQQ